jgi:DNA helicase-2/ATP-dependent DNA helicase PcrA
MRRPDDAVDLTLPPGLTPSQHEAIVAPDPLLCVLAGAGAGKTRVLTLRVARRIVHGDIDPDRVLVCTFSRKAADELRQRLRTLEVGESVRAGTFHRTALSLLRQHRADHRLPAPSVISDRRRLLSVVLEEASSGRRRTRPGLVAQLDSEIGWAKATRVGPGDYARRAEERDRRTMLPVGAVATLYQRYEELRRRQRTLDLDDLLLTCADLLADDAAFAESVRWRFRHLFVDEMQDVNPAQFRLLTSLLGDEPDLMVVGDPNQCVYGWNGADPTLIDRLPSLLPGTRVIALDENHRCSPQVVAVAAAVLASSSAPASTSTEATRPAESRSGHRLPSSTRPDGPIPRVVAHDSDQAEATWLAREIWLAHRPGRLWSNIAVLARTNAQLDTVADALEQGMIPYRHAGWDLGPASDLLGGPDRVRRAGGDRRGNDTNWSRRSSSVSEIDATGDETEGDGTETVSAGTPDLAGDRDGAGREPPDADGVVLMTFHRAKGMQWPAVFVIGLSNGLVPIASARTRDARAEERRLLYVALTRAEEELTCSWARGSGERAPTRTTERSPSPWLAPMERTLEIMIRQSSPLGPREAARRVAELRSRLGAGPS